MRSRVVVNARARAGNGLQVASHITWLVRHVAALFLVIHLIGQPPLPHNLLFSMAVRTSSCRHRPAERLSSCPYFYAPQGTCCYSVFPVLTLASILNIPCFRRSVGPYILANTCIHEHELEDWSKGGDTRKMNIAKAQSRFESQFNFQLQSSYHSMAAAVPMLPNALE